MKTTLAILTLATSLLPSHTRADDTTAASKLSSPMMVQVADTTVAILPANPARTINVASTEGATYSKDTGVTTYKGNVKLVAMVPGQAVVTITGDSLALVPQK